jgi:hypothetical protein
VQIREAVVVEVVVVVVEVVAGVAYSVDILKEIERNSFEQSKHLGRY